MGLTTPAPSFGKDQTKKYNEFNPDDTARGGLKTPVYGRGKISHMKPNYPEPGSPANPSGYMGTSNKKKGK